MDKIVVLDHGFVRLVDKMGGDVSIVRAARVSHDRAWKAGMDEGQDGRLIHYLMKNHHSTPFEAVTATFEVKVPIFIARQWHRHRTQSYNEVSARYTELPEDFYVPRPENIGVQSEKDKQARDFLDLSGKGGLLCRQEEAALLIRRVSETAFASYRILLDSGVPRELARSVLPVNTYTHFFATANLHNWFHFLRLRLHPHAQWEIRQYAEAILWYLAGVAPVAVKAFYEGIEK